MPFNHRRYSGLSKILRASALGAGLSLSVACGSASEPLASMTIVGEFGGDRALLHADASHAILDLTCASVTIATPLVTDGSGRISTTGSRRRTGGAVILPDEGSTPVLITGNALSTDGGTLRLVVSPFPVDPPPPAATAETLSLVRDRKTTLLLCP